MYTIFTLVNTWLARLFAPTATSDPVAGMSSKELADLPIHHPACDPCVG